jgi:hypothetical protein
MMKISHIFAATGLAVASLTIGTSADAQRWDGHRGGGGWHDRGYRGDYGRGWDRGWHGRDYRGYRGGWHGPRYRYRHHRWRGGYGWYGPRCWTEWRYGYRVRICR